MSGPIEKTTSQPESTITASEPTGKPSDSPIELRRSTILFGIVTIVCLAVLPDFHRALFSWSSEITFLYDASSLIVRSLQVTLPILYIVYICGSDWKSIGLVRFSWRRDILIALGLWIFSNFAYVFVVLFMRASSIPEIDAAEVISRPNGSFALPLLFLASCCNGFAEELVIRGYLFSKIESYLSSTGAAILISTCLFASYHYYQGVASMFGIAAMGVIYGIVFSEIRSLWPLAIAHTIADFVGWLSI